MLSAGGIWLHVVGVVFRIKYEDIRNIAVEFAVVQTVSDEEFIRDSEAYVVHRMSTSRLTCLSRSVQIFKLAGLRMARLFMR